MTLLLENAIQVSLIVAAALAAVALFRHRSAALRHWVLSAALACAAIAPAFRPVAPTWSVNVDVASVISRVADPGTEFGAAASPRGDGALTGAPATGSPQVDPGTVVATVWIAGVGLSLLVLAVGLARLMWLTARSHRIASGRWVELTAELARATGVDRPVRLLQSPHPTLLVTWGTRRPDIILPAGAHEWSEDRMRVVLLHELAHIARGDWLTQLVAEGLRAFYWFNPLVWMASRRLRQESEHACDDVVLSGGVDAPEYATHLLDLARAIRKERRLLFPAPAMARPSSLERRFTAMLSANTNRGPLTRPARLATTMAVVAVSVLVAGLGAAQTFSTFSGSIFDSTNRVVPQVTVTLISTQTQAKYSIKSDGTGRFEFVGLPPGTYRFQTDGMGFATMNGTITVAGRDVQRDISLDVGSLEETITITASVSAPSESSAPRVVGGATRAPRQAPACQESTVGGNIKAPMKLRDVRPRYPENMRLAGEGGVVVLDARIGTEGFVIDAQAVDGQPDLAAAAIDAVRQWEFSQTLLNCQPIEVRMKVTANFQIRP